MKKSKCSLAVLLTCATALTWTGAAAACDEPNQAIPDARQSRLLERFGSEGIDADSDGILTHDEVRGFFADRPGKGGPCGCGMHAMKGGGPKGMKGHRRGRPMGGIGPALHRLEMLDSETPPAHFSLMRFPEADLDKNGELSDSEWTAFAAQTRERVLTRLAVQFPETDADGDGSISEAELAALQVETRERCLARHPDADTDGDGVLSADEFEAVHAARAQEHKAKFFERHPEADVDGDGVLTDEERHSFKGRRHDRAGGEHGRHRRGHGPAGGCGGAGE